MSLVTCKECKKEISSEATACPNCGAKQGKTTITAWLALGIVGIVGYNIFQGIGSVPSSRVTVNAAAAPVQSNAGPDSWGYSTALDKMTSKTQKYATVHSVNSMDLSAPYGGKNYGTLTVRSSAKNSAGDVIFSFEKGQSMCRSWEYSCPVLVRFDDKEPIQFMGVGPSDSSTETAFLNNAARFIAEAKKAKRIKVSMVIYQNGTQTLEFGPLTPLEWPKK